MRLPDPLDVDLELWRPSDVHEELANLPQQLHGFRIGVVVRTGHRRLDASPVPATTAPLKSYARMGIIWRWSPNPSSRVVYALHAFQKKSKKGIKTSPADIDKVKAR